MCLLFIHFGYSFVLLITCNFLLNQCSFVPHYNLTVPLFPKSYFRYPLFPKTPGRPTFIPFPLDFISQRQQRWRSRLIHSAVLLSTRSTCVFQLSNFPLTLKSPQLNLLLCLTCLHWLSTQNSQTFPQLNSCHFTKKEQ